MAAKLRRRAALIALARVLRPDTPGIGRRIGAIPRMIKASFTGKYDGAGRLALMALAGVYIISPIDAIPELFTAIIGLIDDAFVATWFAGTLFAETERFLEWEKQRDSVIPGQVIS